MFGSNDRLQLRYALEFVSMTRNLMTTDTKYRFLTQGSRLVMDELDVHVGVSKIMCSIANGNE